MFRYYMFNKPRGCITARSDPRHKTVMDYFPEELRYQVFPVGRLDKDTEGLLLVTDDGQFNFNLLSPHLGKKKTYFFYALGVPDEKKLSDLSLGVKIYTSKDHITAPAEITITEQTNLRAIKDYLSCPDASLVTKKGDQAVVGGFITITEGKKHQVKRMVRYTGAKVLYLKRTSICGLVLDENLGKGEYRPLTDEELVILAK